MQTTPATRCSQGLFEMSRGKYRARAERREAAERTAAASEMKTRIENERRASAAAVARLEEFAALKLEIDDLEQRVAEVFRSRLTACQKLLAEFHAERERDKPDSESIREVQREIEAVASAEGITYLEAYEELLSEDLGREVISIDYVHQGAANKLPVQAVKAIQRARGLRRVGDV